MAKTEQKSRNKYEAHMVHAVHIGNALDRLIFEHRLVLILHGMYGMSWDEIAFVRGYSRRTLARTMRKAKMKFLDNLAA